jgi:metal-sulfur cluster biosynthetic enzyme
MVQESRGHVDIQDADTSNRLERIVENLKHVYDPEISVNIYDLGLIYNISIENDKCHILMSLTSPFCPSVDDIVMDVKMACWSVTGINNVDVDITFTPEWGPDKMSEDAKLILGID